MPLPTTIAVDAMGADRAPKPEVEGAIAAARHYDVRVLLVGQESVVHAELAHHPSARQLPIEIVHAAEVIGMHEKAAQAVRSKRDSSMRVGLRLVREGKAAGFITAGNTGAAMATAKMVLGALPGGDRRALAAVLPTAARVPGSLGRGGLPAVVRGCVGPARRGRACGLPAPKPAAVRDRGRGLLSN